MVPLLLAMALISVLGYRNSKYARWIALLGSLASLVLLYFISYGSYSLSWFSIGTASISISSVITPINMLLLFIVLLVAPLVFVYSFGFMKVPSEQRRFYLEMLAFESAMLVFAMSGDFITLFIAWEFLSLMSYLLIGFYHQKETASRAARKAMTIVLIGDIALLASMIILWDAFGSLSFAAIFSSINTNIPSLYVAVLLLIVAILTKSAQFPFQEWLLDAMEGPTPVSAFLHSTTMVKAGVFALVLLYPLFFATRTLPVLFAFGVITVILSTLNALKETQIKRVIAYSTVQELGLMIVAASTGSIIACLYFFLVQSFYKALLFFSAGSVMETSGEEDLRRASGLRQNRLVYITTLFGVLALAGFVPFSGFFANAAIGSSLISNAYIYTIISLVGLSTSFFIFRWFFLASKKPKSSKIEVAYRTLPKTMILSMLILAILALAGSAAFFYLPGFLGSQSYYLSAFIKPGGLSIGFYDAILETAVAILGVLVSYIIFVHNKSLPSSISSVVYNSGFVNWLYNYFAKLVSGFSEGVVLFDVWVGDLFEDLGKAVELLGRAIRRFSVGNINLYVAIFSLAVVLGFLYVYLYGGL